MGEDPSRRKDGGHEGAELRGETREGAEGARDPTKGEQGKPEQGDQAGAAARAHPSREQSREGMAVFEADPDPRD